MQYPDLTAEAVASAFYIPRRTMPLKCHQGDFFFFGQIQGPEQSIRMWV